jgi:hypothetical protein
MAPQNKGSQEQKKQTIELYQSRFLNIPKKTLCYFIAIRVQRWFVELQVIFL